MIGEIMDESDWKWVEGIVDTNEDHIKIRYGDDPEPIAVVAPDEGKTFVVQSLVNQLNLFDKSEQEIPVDVRKELDFYLVELGEEDPWAYAIYHCSTASNMYSNVHWGYYPKGYEGR